MIIVDVEISCENGLQYYPNMNLTPELERQVHQIAEQQGVIVVMTVVSGIGD